MVVRRRNKGGRPAGDKTRCGGRWTEARYRTFVCAGLRVLSLKWAPVTDALTKARVGRGNYLCAGCKSIVPGTTKNDKGKRVKFVYVDHVDPVVDPATGFIGWDSYIERLLCEVDNLQVLCLPCHSQKSAEENEIRTAHRREKKQEIGEDES